jgi:hypothetical protein
VTALDARVARTADGSTATAGYRPGVCNIGPAEITRRRRTGHVGLLATILGLVLLIAIDAPPLARLLLILPATVSAAGYLQAWLRFCAGFGARGVINFGPLGRTDAVADGAARALDRRQARRIGLASLAIGVIAGLVAVALPV